MNLTTQSVASVSMRSTPANSSHSSFEESSSPPINAWVLALIAFGDRRGRAWSRVVVATFVIFLGWMDYVTGTQVSLGWFYLMPIILSALWLGWESGCIVSLLCIFVRVAADAYGGSTLSVGVIFWSRTAYLASYLIFVGLLHALITLQRHLEKRVEERTAALAQALKARDELQRQLYETSSRERSRIGHELHDGLGQHLTATALAAKMLSSELEASLHPLAADAKTIVRLTQEGIAQTRQLARGLLLAAVKPDELAAELGELCDSLRQDSIAHCSFSCLANLRDLDEEQSSHLFYIAHEAARNAVRHARASRIEIKIECVPDGLQLSVTDNGSGPPAPDAKLTGMGLRIMAHRSELMGGRFAVSTGSEGGAKITCTIAVPSAVVLS